MFRGSYISINEGETHSPACTWVLNNLIVGLIHKAPLLQKCFCMALLHKSEIILTIQTLYIFDFSRGKQTSARTIQYMYRYMFALYLEQDLILKTQKSLKRPFLRKQCIRAKLLVFINSRFWDILSTNRNTNNQWRESSHNNNESVKSIQLHFIASENNICIYLLVIASMTLSLLPSALC